MPRTGSFTRRAAALVSVTLLSSVVAAQTAKVDLRPKFITGHELRYRMSVHSVGSTSIPGLEDTPADVPAKKTLPKNPGAAKPPAPGTEPDQEMTQAVDVRFRVVDAYAEGGATVEMIYDAIKLTTKGPLGDTAFDSTKPAAKDGDDPGAAYLRKIVGTTLTLRVDRDGNITDIKGGDALLPAGLGDAASSLVSGPGVQQTWGPIFTGRKGSGEASIGEKWTTTDTLNVSPIGAFTITTESVLASARAGNAEVDFKGRIEPARESSRPGEGIQIRSASHAGKYVWDVAAGSLRTLTMKQSMEAGGTLAGMAMSTTQKSETTVERLEGRSTNPAPAVKPADKPQKPLDFRPRRDG